MCAPPAVEFRNSLEAKLGVELPSTLVFDYPSVAAIAAHVATLLPKAELPDTGAVTASDADFFSFVLDAPSDVPYPPALASGGTGGSRDVVAVGVAAVVTRQPAGIMAAGNPTRQGFLHCLPSLGDTVL